MDMLAKKKEYAVTDELIAAVAHEIRNPLSSVKMNLQVFSRGLSALASGNDVSVPKLEEHLRVALRAVDHLERIVNDLMDISRPVVPEFSKESVVDVMDSALLLAEKELVDKDIQVVKKIDSLPTVEVDARRLEQALLNIFLNSIHAMEKGGRLDITATANGKMISITIEDNGKGMTQEVLGRVFEPFFTTSRDGTGLGLTLSKRLIERHNGTIDIESEQGKGTRVTVRVPCKQK
jgi:signal transduction histidine kinase